ncbi:DNA cytosine methyltransferase [Helicobacter pylori]|nr:DNA cytosine methyltransferase [Helicobacter pylori]
MGFPKDFKKIGTSSQLYERIGNSICVPMVKAIIKSVKSILQTTP